MTTISKEMAPPIVDGLEFLEVLGEGGFGQVWKARRRRPSSGTVPSSQEPEQEQLMAVKIMTMPSLENASSVQREVEIWKFLSLSASRLLSMNLMPIVRMLGLHHATSSDGQQQQVCISMQLCNGGTLADVFPLNESKAMALAHTLARGLHMCHALGVLHLDVKPQNVLFPSPVCRDACLGALLADFGLFLPSDAPFIKNGRGAGTCGYQAPEVITDGIYSPAADAWSLGALLLEALTGHLPPHDPWGDPDELILEFEQWDSSDALSPSWVDDYMRDVWSCSEWASLSTSAKDAIRGLLCPNPLLRLTLQELLNHPWLHSEELLHKSYVDAFLPPGTPSSVSACAAAMAVTTSALSHHVRPAPPGFV